MHLYLYAKLGIGQYLLTFFFYSKSFVNILAYYRCYYPSEQIGMNYICEKRSKKGEICDSWVRMVQSCNFGATLSVLVIRKQLAQDFVENTFCSKQVFCNRLHIV